MQIAQYDTPPTLGQLFRLWSGIGLQSFGGGASTVFLIQRTFIEQHRWLTAEEFTQFWALCLFTPGINLIAVTVLIGRKLGGVSGIAVSLAGMLVPSATITSLMAAGFVIIQHFSATSAILRGVVPATAGVMALVAWNFARPVVQREFKAGWWPLSLNVILMLVAAVTILLFKLSVAIVLVGIALVGMVLFTPWRTAQPPTPDEGSEEHD